MPIVVERLGEGMLRLVLVCDLYQVRIEDAKDGIGYWEVDGKGTPMRAMTIVHEGCSPPPDWRRADLRQLGDLEVFMASLSEKLGTSCHVKSSSRR